MYLHKLNLTNVRALHSAEFDFLGRPGVHLIVGVNGVGKSTTLEALRVLLSQLIPRFMTTGVRGISFSDVDITQGESYLGAQLTGQVMHYSFRYTIDYKLESIVPEKGPVQGDRIKAIETPDIDNLYLEPIMGPKVAQRASRLAKVDEQAARRQEVKQHPRNGLSNPLAIYYSPHRSLTTTESAKIGNTQSPAYVEALSDKRDFSSKMFADWWRARNADERTDLATLKKLEAVFEEVVTTFLPGCHSIELCDSEDPRQFLITKNGFKLSIRQLSDGERSILSLALDLARRLYLANPQLDHPIKEGQAIVLIDELDLHLHPSWQRDVVKRLETTFPSCQIIASTHSAQLVGEVTHNKVNLIYPTPPQVEKPTQSFGMEAGWILQTLFESPDQNKEIDALEKQLFLAIQTNQLGLAQKLLDKLRERINGTSGKEAEATAWINRLNSLKRSNEANN
jgi:predicted ATP-binding protein involved in virulence